MKLRKIILLCACGLLLVVCILQTLLKSKDNAKTFTLDTEPNKLEIISADNTYTVQMEGDVWVVGEKKYPAADSSVNGMISGISSFKVLDKVASANNDITLQRYDLTSEKAVTVIAKKDDKILRTITIGKSSTANTQDYITVDDAKDVYLASGGLRNLFNKTVDSIRSKTVATFDQNKITSITVNAIGKSSWTVSRSGSGENMMWLINLPDAQVDSKKASDWFNSFASVVTTLWHDTDDLNGDKLADLQIIYDNKPVTFTLYSVKNLETDSELYYASSSETPYYFELPTYSVAKFQKTAEDVIQ